jgi:uncharacterized protein
MKIDLANLPDEGQLFEGELKPEIFDLEGSDTIPAGPLLYRLFAQRFDTELLITGNLEATFELTCMRSLHGFKQTVELEGAAISIEIGNDGEIDASEAIREEVLLELPTNPRCEDGDTPGKCQIDPKYLAVDKSTNDGVDNAPAQDGPNPWAALDVIDSNDQPS